MIVLYILLALFVLLMMVTIHEFGHYIAGKILGFKINEFSIGFGKSLFSHKCKSGEIFSIRLFPLGGYCAFEGEEENSENSGAFIKQKPWKRLIVLFNGAFFNFISAIIFCFILLVSVGYDVPQVYLVNQVVKVESVYLVDDLSSYDILESDVIKKLDGKDVELKKSTLCSYMSDRSVFDKDNYTLTIVRQGVEKELVMNVVRNTNYSGSESGLLDDDVIYAVNNTSVDFIKDNTFTTLISKNTSSSSVTLKVKRNGEAFDLVVNYFDSGFVKDDGTYNKAIGVQSTAYRFTVGESLVRCVPYTFGFSWQVLKSLGGLITGQISLTEVGGPIYTIGTIATLSQVSINYFLILLPLIAANLAIFNWLPFPALDGSKMLLTTIEWIKGKPLFSQKTENIINTVGFIVLLGFVILADLYHIIIGL